MISELGLYNMYWVYIIPSLFGGFYNVIIYTSNFKAIPDGLLESAKMDGASEFQIYSCLVLPLSKSSGIGSIENQLSCRKCGNLSAAPGDCRTNIRKNN